MSSDHFKTHASTDFPRLDTSELFKSGKEIEIMHQGSIYRLRITSTGKLLLTK